MPTMHYGPQQNKILLSKQDFTFSQYKRKLIAKWNEKQKKLNVFVLSTKEKVTHCNRQETASNK